eukprot:1194342-Prorocentrum_minimum.AAC.2
MIKCQPPPIAGGEAVYTQRENQSQAVHSAGFPGDPSRSAWGETHRPPAHKGRPLWFSQDAGRLPSLRPIVDVRGTNVDVRGTKVDVRGTNVDVRGTNVDVSTFTIFVKSDLVMRPSLSLSNCSNFCLTCVCINKSDKSNESIK